jgi:hypothetical protein
MDPLIAHDLRIAGETSPGKKLQQALEMMSVGLRLKRDVLKNLRPGASDAEIDAELERWLFADD